MSDQPGRKPNGDFGEGNEFGKMPRKTSMRRFNEEFRESFFGEDGKPNDEWKAARAELFRLATQDDDMKVRLAAIKYLLDRLCGRPQQSVEVEGLGETLNIVFAEGMREAAGDA